MNSEENSIQKINSELASFDKEWESNDRANTRRDRHTQLSTLNWEDSHFDSHSNVEENTLNTDEVSRILERLTQRQRFLLWNVAVQGYKFTDLARIEGKSESAIRKAYNRAIIAARKYAS